MSQKIKGLISVAGLIGVGKTTLAENLSIIMGGEVIYEKYKENPFLTRQFGGCKKAALPSELFFLLTRAQQLASERYESNQLYISDYIFQKNRFFAGMSLDDRQLQIYDEVEEAVSLIINKPDLVIYLYDTIDNCLSRINSRGREFERNISGEFLGKLQAKYQKCMDNWDSCPVIKLDCSNYDFRKTDDVAKVREMVLEYFKK